MDEELLEVIAARELRSQHLPRPMSRHEKNEEHIWQYHDLHHTGTLVGCADCVTIRGELHATGRLPAYVQ